METATTMQTGSNILLVYTGGTIGMMEDAVTGSLCAFDFSYMEQYIPEMKRFDFNVECIQFDPPIDSANITFDLWYKLANTIAKRYHEFDGFVILHGTDTMAYTASAISFMLEDVKKPIIFTGSQLPIGKLRTDGKENLITAIQIAAAKRRDGSAVVPEVCIYFDNYLMRANRTIKYSADSFDAFKSYNFPPLAHAGINIAYNEKYIHLPADPQIVPLNPIVKMEENVAILKLYPGIAPKVVEAVLNISELKGLIIETYGSGNAPTFDWFVKAIEATVKRGVVVVNVSQCQSGSVEMQRYDTGAHLSSVGVLSGFDMTTETALTKLMYLLGQCSNVDEVRRRMTISICGEMTTDPD